MSCSGVLRKVAAATASGGSTGAFVSSFSTRGISGLTVRRNVLPAGAFGSYATGHGTIVQGAPSTTVRWMSDAGGDGGDGAVERTEEEKAAIKAKREAKK